MDRFRVGPCAVDLLHPADRCLVLLSFPEVDPDDCPETYLTRQEAAHLAGVLVHCVLQRSAPDSADKAFREMTVGELLDARAFPQETLEVENGPVVLAFPPGV